MEVSITKSCVRNRLGDTKTECWRRPVPLHPLVLESLLDWKRQSLYKNDGDFLFPSIRLNGTKPLSPDSLLKKPFDQLLSGPVSKEKSSDGTTSAIPSGLCFEHSERTSKSRRISLRHANSRTTLDIYTHAVSQQKEMPTRRWLSFSCPGGYSKARHLSAPSPL